MDMSAADPAVPSYVSLDADHASLLLDLRGAVAAVMHWGQKLTAATDAESLAALASRPMAPGGPAREPVLALTPLTAHGFIGAPGLVGHRAGTAWAPAPRLIAVEQATRSQVRLIAYDAVNQLRLIHSLALDAATGVLVATATVVNEGDADYWLEHLGAPVLPIPLWATDLMGYSGRWAGEFRTERQPIGSGAYVRENRRGRTSHDNQPSLILLAPNCNETAGAAAGFHLGASGNHRLRVERLADGRGLVELAELLLPGEIRLQPGESYCTPELFAVVSTAGLNGLSQRCHEFVRTRILPPEVASRPRPVHYNTWEAVYFNHATEVLADLAVRAADLGVERFVLDDGWFGGRRNDRAGLGDWIVSREVYPEGLAPLIAHVRALGMEFGLWVEPEMVNPDSDLFRSHPDWVLQLPGIEQIESRHQLVLDLTRHEVAEHLFARLHALLSEHAIGYLKWDMNRDINHPGGADGRAVASRQVRAVHALIDRLRARHPTVEIESCASGGGRANYEILRRTHRLWTSDNNDALDRLVIQRGFSYFLPPEVMGSHVGPRDCHITGRRIPMATRAAVAMFGHMGLEVDLRELDDAEAATLQRAITLHKQQRPLLHHGRLVRLDLPEHLCGFGVVAPDCTQALFFYALLSSHPTTVPGRYRFAGLDAGARYRLGYQWPEPQQELGCFTGEALMSLGLELPLLRPQSARIFQLRKL
jgi:alpha-galactosidase